jgi:SprT protein
LSSTLEQQVVLRVKQCLEMAGRVYRRDFSLDEIRFDLRGRAAGQVRFPQARSLFGSASLVMRFNAELLHRYAEEFIAEVVPHECAHAVVYHLYRPRFRSGVVRPKPHGVEWQNVMRDIYKLEPKVTHNFVLAPNVSRHFSYICGCEKRVHQVSIIRHNKMKRGRARYLCKGCGQALVEWGMNMVSQ